MKIRICLYRENVKREDLKLIFFIVESNLKNVYLCCINPFYKSYTHVSIFFG